MPFLLICDLAGQMLQHICRLLSSKALRKTCIVCTTQWYILKYCILLPIWVHFWARILLLKVIYGLQYMGSKLDPSLRKVIYGILKFTTGYISMYVVKKYMIQYFWSLLLFFGCRIFFLCHRFLKIGFSQWATYFQK